MGPTLPVWGSPGQNVVVTAPMAMGVRPSSGHPADMPSRPQIPDEVTSSAALSLRELQRHLLRKAGTLGARARVVRSRGAQRKAAKLSQESDLLLLMAKQMGDKIR